MTSGGDRLAWPEQRRGQPARYIVLAYGPADAVYRQATMAFLSLLVHAPEPRELVAVTDHPERFEWLHGFVRVHPVSAADITAWRGIQPFSMRQKLVTARILAPSDGILVLLDADTLVTADLSPFVAASQEGALMMHKREFELGASRRRGNRALWEQLRGRTFGQWAFRADDAMWNSGVLALPASEVGLLDEALQLYDAMGAAGVRHFATEQLVVGLVLGRTGRLREAQPWFTHYWGNKAQFDREISRRLEEAHRQGWPPAQAAEALRRNPIDLPVEVRPGKFEKFRRWFRRV